MVVVTSLPSPRDSFTQRKTRILSQLAVPEAEYTDASPKGSVDAGIRSLIDEINAQPGLVTTSSCAGRASVYLEGRKKKQAAQDEEREQQRMKVMGQDASASSSSSSGGGKGGGEWLFVSHDPFPGRSDGGERYYERLLLGIGEGEGAVLSSTTTTTTADEGGGHGGAARLIHFKFEPMVSEIPGYFT